MRIKLGTRTLRPTRTKFAVYCAPVRGQRVLRGRSTKLYFAGVCDILRLQREVIPKIKEYIRSGRSILFPLVVQSYISKAPALKKWAGGAQKRPDPRSRRLEFLIDKHYGITSLAEDGTIPLGPDTR